jgi:hypothetical protein
MICRSLLENDIDSVLRSGPGGQQNEGIDTPATFPWSEPPPNAEQAGAEAWPHPQRPDDGIAVRRLYTRWRSTSKRIASADGPRGMRGRITIKAFSAPTPRSVLGFASGVRRKAGDGHLA